MPKPKFKVGDWVDIAESQRDGIYKDLLEHFPAQITEVNTDNPYDHFYRISTDSTYHKWGGTGFILFKKADCNYRVIHQG